MRRLLRELFGLCASGVLVVVIYGVPFLSLMGWKPIPVVEVTETPDYFAELALPAPAIALPSQLEAAPATPPPPAVEEPSQPPTPTAPGAIEPNRAIAPQPRSPSRAARTPSRTSKSQLVSRFPVEIVVEPNSVVKKRSPTGKKCPKDHRQIRPVGASRYEVERSVVDYYTASIANFNSLGWSKKYREGNEKGWWISGFSCDSPLHFGGLKRGDVIQSVNGKKTNTALQILTAYTMQQNRDLFVVQILRDGKKLTMHYDVIAG